MESNFGNDADTYKANYHGGIWQVDEIGFKGTQDVASHDKLTERFKQIRNATDIIWQSVTWEDLRIPIYSGIAARLFLLNDPTVIPTTVRGQARYWKEYYNTEKGEGTVENFINKDCS